MSQTTPRGSRIGPEVDVARAAAVEAGTLLRDRFGQPGIVRRNGRHDVVAEVDALSEQIVVGHLRAVFPDDAIVAEESGAHGHAARTWLVDPLDGTVNFASGIPFFAVSVALLIGGRAVVGVVHDPVRRETFAAVAGRGAQAVRAGPAQDASAGGGGGPTRSHRLRIRPLRSVADAVVAIDPGDPEETVDEDARGLARLRFRIRVSRTLGSAALSLAWVGAGRLDGFVRPAGIQPLDVMAGGLVAAEAGAAVGDPRGGSWPDLARAGVLIGIVGAHPRVHRAVLDALG